jgi:glycosyltransferase involved in cell wall biosynthesis
VVPVSNFSKTFIKAKISPEKITVIPNGFDLDDMDGISLHEKNSNGGKLDLVTVGTVWPRKGHHNVFKALPKLLKEYPELKYNIVGRHADLSLVKTYFDDEAFSNIVKITGQVSDKVKIEILSKSDIFILLSETQTSGDFEGFGIAVIEANYFGLPAIGSKSSGLEDSINNGVSGMLVDPKDPDDILNAVKLISENYSEFSKNAREWALQHHWSGIVKRYITAINDIK